MQEDTNPAWQPDLLGLPSLKSIKRTDTGNHFEILVVGRHEPTACPECDSGLYRHGSKSQQFIDTPLYGKPVMLNLERQRYRCKVCRMTFFEPLPDIDDKRFMTERLVKYIQARSIKQTFAQVARDLGIDPKTVRRVFDDFSDVIRQEVHFETPEILGIDELKIIGEYRCMLTNIEKLSIYNLLPTRKKVDLMAYFDTMPDKHKVRVVTMDMWNVYRQVAFEQFPCRPIVADRFHVVRMATNAMEAVRKRVKRSLDANAKRKLTHERFILLSRFENLSDKEKDKLLEWVKQFPVLGIAHAAKEAFTDIYREPTKEAAQRAARAWLARMPAEIAKDFRETSTALRNWREQIFAWYDYPVSNAYTESVNRLAKDLNRMGRGYRFEVVKARLLLDPEARKATSTTIRSRSRRPAAQSSPVGMDRMVASSFSLADLCFDEPEKVVEYGPHIPTLCRLLEAGHFD